MATIISLVPRTCSHLLNYPSCIFENRTKKIQRSLSTTKPQTLGERRFNFSLGVSNRVPPSNESYEEDLEVESGEPCPTKSYNITLWGDYFRSFTPIENEEALKNEHRILMEDVRREFLSTKDKPLDHLKFIDAIERLGVAYHFKDEIEESLAEMYRNYNTYEDDEQYDLYHASLAFRILRQHGFFVSCDSFQKFTDKNKIFPESLATDTLGILSLFEASHFRISREEILEEALSFTTRHLTSIKLQADNPFFEEVNHALSRPFQKSLVRLEARHHIMMYQHDPSHSETLLKFAKVDFNILQSVYRKELQELTRWWEELHYAENFPYARDRLLENYFVPMTVKFEPKYSLSRMISTKSGVWMTVMDDLYDTHETSDELKDLVEAIERWDKSCIHGLPGYIKVFYKMMLDDFDQFKNDLVEAGYPNYLEYLIDEVKVYSRAHFKMLKCREAKNAVEYEEYLRYGMIGVAVRVASSAIITTIGAEVKNEDLECFSLFPSVVRNPAIISKFLNDIAGYETDKDEGGVSTVFCYMKQYGVSREEACAALTRQIEDAWIDMNEEMSLYPRTRMRKLLYDLMLPVAQISSTIYANGEDGFRMVNNIMKDCISRTLADPITC